MKPVAPVRRVLATRRRGSRRRSSVGCRAHGRVAVVTDTTAYLPPELVERHGIRVVPLYVVFGGDRTVRESDITDYPAFFEELRSAESLPTTSQPSVGDFIAVFEPLLAGGGDVVSVHISGGLSGTHRLRAPGRGAARARRQRRRAHRVVDSTTAAGGLGMMVLAAAKAAGERPERERDGRPAWPRRAPS